MGQVVTAIRIAIVGLGKIARDQHIASIAGTDGIELAAIASRNASIEGIAHFATLDQLLAEAPDIDAVALCTPPQVRGAQAAAALKAGKHVLLEKPPGATVSELAPLVAAARQNRTNAVCDLAFAFRARRRTLQEACSRADRSSRWLSSGRRTSGSGIPARPGSGSRAD